ncbi:MAG: PAS domain S-box protein [Caldilineaceae bacterium]|nr:PAS domain S-box protein [Caldilineaceae bacterium]
MADNSLFPLEQTGEIFPQVIDKGLAAQDESAEYVRTSRPEFEEMRLAMATAQMGTWALDLETFEVRRSFTTDELFHLPADGSTRKLDEYLARIHPEDLGRFQETIRQAIIEKRDHTVEYRIMQPDGTVRWVSSRGTVLVDAEGKAIRKVGALTDITEQKRAEEALRLSEERFRIALQNSPIIVFNHDLDLRYTWIYNNPRFNNPPLPADADPNLAILGKRDAEIMAIPEEVTILESLKRQVLESGQGKRQEIQITLRQGPTLTFDLTLEPLRNERGEVIGLTGAAIDITEHKENKASLEDRARQQAIIAELGQQALTGMDLNSFIQNVVTMVATTLNAEFCKVMELLPDGARLLLRAGTGWQPSFVVGETTISAGLESHAGYTLQSKEPIIVKDARQETRFHNSDLLKAHNVISGMSVMIGGRHSPYGVLSVHTTRHRIFNKDQVNFLQSIANLLAMTIERRRAETEQMRLLAEVRAAHAEAEHERQRLYDLFMNVPAAVCVIHGPDHVYQMSNAAHSEWLMRGNVIGRSIHDVHPPALAEKVEELLDQVYQTGKPYIGKERRILLYDEEGLVTREVFANIVYHPITDANGTVTGIFSHAVDVTEQVRARQQIETLAAERERNLAQLRAIFDSMTEGLVIADPDGYVREMNPAGLALHGFAELTDAQMYLHEYADLFELLDAEGNLLPLDAWPIARTLRQEQFRTQEVCVRRKDSGVEWFGSYSGTPVYDGEGNFLFAVLTIRDVSEQKETERILQDSEARFRGTFENAAVGMAQVTLDGHWLRVNERLCQIIGYSAEELLDGMSFQDITYPDDLEADLTHLEQMIRREIPSYQMEKRYFHKDGHLVWVNLTAALERDEQGDPLYAISVIEDITERRAAEEALREARRQQAEILALLETSLANAPIGFAFFDHEHRYIRVNDTLARLNCIPVEAHLGRTLSELLPDVAVNVDPLIDQVFQSRRSIENLEITTNLPKAPEVTAHWLMSLYPVTDPQGAPIYVGVVLVDITDRKRAEEALRQSEARFRVMAETLPDILFTCQANGAIDYINQRFHRYTGIQSEQALGFGWTTSIHPEDIQRHRQEWQHALVEGLTFENEFRLRTHKGDYRWFMGRAHPIFDESAEIVRWIGTCTDIHDQKLAEAALRQSEQQLRLFNETLEERVQQRTRQVRELASALTLAEQRERRRISQILHDHVQQMLYGIQMRNHLLKLDAEPESEPVIHSHIRIMQELVEQAIRSTRSLSVELSPPVLKNEGLASAFEWLAGNMREIHGLEVQTHLVDDYQPASEDLRVLVFQITRELLFNVVKHANVDHARLEMAESGEDLVVRVIDEGSGFDFAATDRQHSLEGGFGLYSIQERLALFGGHLRIESMPNKGTIATVVVPQRPSMPFWQNPREHTQL